MRDYGTTLFEPEPLKVIIDLDSAKGLYVIKYGEEMPIEEFIRRLVKGVLDERTD